LTPEECGKDDGMAPGGAARDDGWAPGAARDVRWAPGAARDVRWAPGAAKDVRCAPGTARDDGRAPGGAPRDVSWDPVGTRGGKGTAGAEGAREELEILVGAEREVMGFTVLGAVN